MRMWMIKPNRMCRQHLLGEHLEVHMFAKVIYDGKKLDGYINNGLLEVSAVVRRHNNLVLEMQRRNYKHRSPLKYVGSKRYLKNISKLKHKKIDANWSAGILFTRCSDCRSRLLKELTK